MNYADSERIAAQLEKNGFLAVSLKESATLVVVNSCGVRQTAEDRIFSFIHNIWKNNPRTKIILTGCLADRKDVQKKLKNKVNLFINIKNFQKDFKKFVSCHPELAEGSNKKIRLPRPFGARNDTCEDYLHTKPKYTNKHTAYIPIMTGCNNFCSYCVVPYARGREISRPAEEILREVKGLIKKGYKEIVLLGQNVNSYISPSPFQGEGRGGVKGGVNFSELLKKINAIPGHFWISFISNHPKDFSEELIKTATGLPKVCEFIHLPLQAGDNQILKKMNRKYTRQEYLKLVDKIKKSFQQHKPDKLYSLTSDIIVGFPGETQKQFLESAKVMKKSIFDMVYFGQYSPRPGTATHKFKDNISRIEKSRREKYLNEILKKTSFTNNQKYLEKTVEVLIEKEASIEASIEDSKKVYFGRTRTIKNVKIISTRKNLIGKIIKAEIIKTNTWNLEAKIK